MLSPTRLVERLYFSYILFFVLLLSVGWTMLPPSHNLALQLGMWLTGLMVSLYALKRSITSIAVIVFVYQAFFISVNSWINLAEYGDILGFNPQDADFYRFCGEAYGDKSFTIFILWLSDIFPTVDDRGFPSLMWLTYKLFGHSAAPWAIRLLNAAVIAWGSERLYRISCGFLEKQESKVVALLWGLMPFATHTAAYGTKENFFVFVVISFFYFLHRNADRGSVWSLSLIHI